MRAIFIGVLLLLPGVAATAGAQSHGSRRAQHAASHTGAPAPAPPPTLITVPAPGIGLLPPTGGLTQIVPFHDGEFPGSVFAQVRNRGTAYPAPAARTRGFGTPAVGYLLPQYMPQYFWPQYAVAVAPPPRVQLVQERVDAPVTTGNLVLQVDPPTVQVFVDGYFFGMSEDFDGRRGALALEPGTHRIQIIAPGYESVTLAATIAAAQTVTYQASMKPAVIVTPIVPAAPVEHKMMYLIPGCYLGNVPPADAGLPAGCDVSKARTFQP